MFLRNGTTGLVHRLGDRTLIGRSSAEDCDIPISHRSVSRTHAEIIKTPDGFIIRDLDSRNGTYVNSERIQSETPIFPRDVLMIGNTEFFVQTEEYVPEIIHKRKTEEFLSESPLESDISKITRASIEAETLDVSTPAGDDQTPISESLLRSQIKLIADLTSTIRHAASLSDFESRIAGQILKMFPKAKRCLIILKSMDAVLSVRAAAFASEGSEKSVKISKTVINHVLEQSRSILSTDTMHESPFEEAESIAEAEIHSFICAPLLGKDEPVGAIFLDVIDSMEHFSEEDLTFLTVIANQTALAIENSQLIECLGLDRDRLLEENTRLRVSESAGFDFEDIVFSSPKMKAVLEHTRKVARADSSVLVLGERGTGKELVAHAVHFNSGRRDEPFVIVNCAATQNELVDSELFGHERGAFTGADKTKPGLFEVADRGSLFLDEIGDLPLGTQAKLLRAVENGQIRRLGGTKDMDVDVRIIVATNKDLKTEVAAKRFRPDLYDRLNVAVIKLPSLSERKEDILPLANHFLRHLSIKMNKRVTGFSAEALNILFRYDWPGNVRELRNFIERAMIEVKGETVLASHFPADIARVYAGEFEGYKRIGKLSDAEAALKREMIIETLQKTRGNKSRAAEILGVSRAGLRKMMAALSFSNDFGKD
ncbi:MAG: sigma 54-interacting transcriptional regulator [Candidatus Aminicenantes bacterium]|nr:sigma 54-interacting transcriptional regulator [Candidatus Aminicenantes bacterium]